MGIARILTLRRDAETGKAVSGPAVEAKTQADAQMPRGPGCVLQSRHRPLPSPTHTPSVQRTETSCADVAEAHEQVAPVSVGQPRIWKRPGPNVCAYYGGVGG